MRIETKVQMYELLTAGRFGNSFRVWDSEEAFLQAVEDGFDWLVGVRCVGPPGLPYHHHKTPLEAVEIGLRLKREYRCPVRYYEASPDQYITIQGEIGDLPYGYVVEYSTIKTHMRAAFAQERLTEFSYRMPSIIRRHFNEASLGDLYSIFEQCPESVVEFTAYESLIGELKGRNVCIWECRHY